MAILAGDIKLVASQVMDDVPEGGGAPTSTVIADGVSNAIFNDISEVDRAMGRVNMRKTFVSVQTPNRDGYFGANVIVAGAPDDPRVSVSLCSTGETFDRRDDAKGRIESYLTGGTMLSGYLFGAHVTGMRSVTLLMRTNVEPPNVGESIVLRKFEGQVTEVEQFVRITDVNVTERTFEVDSGEFKRNEVVLSISDALRADFPGFETAFKFDAALDYTGKTRVRATVVADAANYYGVVPSVEDASTGDFTIQAESIFTQLVPSAQVETPIADARMNQQAAALVAGSGSLVQTMTTVFATAHNLFVGGGILPGSLSIARGGVTLADQGGKLNNSADGTQVGTVDYSNGVLALTTDVFGSAGSQSSGVAYTVTYTPAVAPTTVTDSIGVSVTQGSQSLTYVIPIPSIPARASTQVSYRAQGRWYVLTEDGSGALRGASTGTGVGSLNFATGTLSLTLGALPDIGSEIIVTFASTATSVVLSALPSGSLNERVFHAISVGAAIKPGTVTITWNDGTARTTSDVNGALTGVHATGEVDYARGYIRISPNVLPAVGTIFTVNITEGTNVESDVIGLNDGGASWTFSLAGLTRPGSVEIGVAAQLPVREYPGLDKPTTRLTRLFDDASGNLKIASATGNLTVGTIDYGTGACTILKSVASYADVQTTYVSSMSVGASSTVPPAVTRVSGTETRAVTLTILNGTAVAMTRPAWAWWEGAFSGAAKVKRVGADGSAFSGGFPLTSLIAQRGHRMELSLGSDRYKRVGGYGANFQVNVSPATGVGTAAGTLSMSANALYGVGPAYTYSDGGGYVQLTVWTPGVSATIGSSVGVASGAISGADTLALIDSATFRTAVAPIRVGSFSVSGTMLDGTVVTATADEDGVISVGTAAPSAGVYGSAGVWGTVNYETGVVKLRFGKRAHADDATVTGVADLTTLGVPGVQYVFSAGVQADSLRYNAAAFSYLPLDADLIGIDPVRLPSDGRVPIFRAGTVAVVGHTAEVPAATVSNAQTIDCGRVRLSRVRVIGNDGVVINMGYSANLEAGTVTFTNVAGYSQPVTVEHRIEDMMLVRDAQIGGQLTFTRPLTHNYPAGSYVSSALVIGDMKARVSVMFDQLTWSNAWADAVSGSNAAASYNDVANPIVVTNDGAVTERWALVFTGSTAYNIVGEHVGIVATGNTSLDCAPLNPATGAPYFTIAAVGWGNGWVGGNALRFNTVGAVVPVWVVRTIQQGPETVDNDSFTLLIRGDVDNT